MGARRPLNVRWFELEPPDVALVVLALEQLIGDEGSSPIADRAVVLAAYLRLQRHQSLHRDNHLGNADPLPEELVRWA